MSSSRKSFPASDTATCLLNIRCSGWPLAFCLGLALTATGLAQDNASPPVTKVLAARSLYYTPADQGLQSFHCDVTFNWKSFLETATNQSVPDDDPKLEYLQGVHITVDDTLRTGGALIWSASTPAPEGTEESVTKIREGLQQIWAGFLQSWNGFISGDLVSLDRNASVEHSNGAYRVAVHTTGGLAEEEYDPDLILQKIHVVTPSLESTIQPIFQHRPGGLLVSEIDSKESQPPSAPPVDVKMEIRYADVEQIHLPSHLQVSVGATQFEYQLRNCSVKMQKSAHDLLR